MINNLANKVDENWTLFLDRDGVINVEQKNDYVRNWDMFTFCENALKSFPIFSKVFKRIIIVTNQRGIGKGLMTIEQLDLVHAKMISSIIDQGGRIDKIYYCTAISNEDPCRKPNIGMGLNAKKDFPEIEFSKSIIIGNSISDMEFGKNLGMNTIFIMSKEKDRDTPLIDIRAKDLYEIANFFEMQ